MNKQLLNQEWQFHYGEIKGIKKTAKKAHAFGGLTAPLADEAGERVTYSAGGDHFLKLIAQGNVENGLHNLAGTDLDSQMDGTWSTVTLPHDWKVQLPYENDPANLMSGSKPDGVGYYRRTFELSDTLLEQKRVILHFDGVMRMADVWLNGAYLGHNNSGYTSFEFDVTEMARYGAEGVNVLLVRVDTTTGPEGWWYEGAGIYKGVWLEVLPLVAIERDSVYAYTKKLTTTQAEVQLTMTVQNKSEEPAEVQPVIQLADESYVFEKKIIPSNEDASFTKTIQLNNPILWSPENPHLYEVNFWIAGDEVKKNFGIRTFAYDEQGFYLNGQPYELRGVCEHQDFASVGVALTQDIVDYKVKIMKEMGINAWRSAHHFASEELLDACDRLGVLVMNENRLLESTPWRVADLEKMVKQSRMHPSIAFWSIANEEVIGNTPMGSRIAKKLIRAIKKHDQEHLLVSAELLNPQGIIDEDYLANFDVLGVNYPEAGVMGSGAAIIKEQHPHMPMMSTESASYFSTRGVYKDDGDCCQCNNFGSMYSMVLPGKREPGDPGVGGTARPEEVLQYLQERPYMGGVFLWTAFDYFGEPAPFGWPGIGSQFGIADVCGFPKDYYYYYQSHWTKAPMVHVMPHWNREALDIDGNGEVAIRAFSNAEAVELFVNEQSFGRQSVADCQCNWRVPYVAGELKVIAYQDNQEVAQDSRQTSDDMAKVQVKPIYTGKEQTLYEVNAFDAQGKFVPTANHELQISAENGTVIGLGNGNPADISDYSKTNIHLFNGKALVIATAEAKISACYNSRY